MPFQSKAQARYLFALKPEIAKEFAAKTKKMASLPEHKGKKESSSKKKPATPKTA